MPNMAIRPPCDEAAIRARPASVACSPSAGRWVLVATILGSSMAFIDSSAVNVALPVIQRDLGASAAQVQWVVEIYLLFLGALVLVGGALGDRRGRVRVFVWGVSVFALASIWCGVSPGAGQLILARAAQGLGAALLVPGSLSIIGASFDDEARGKAIGTWSGATAITMAAGPVVGGWVAETLSWRWVFFLNIPLAIAVVLISVARVPETRDDSARGGVDWTGAVLSVTGLGALVWGLIESSTRGLGSAATSGAIAAGLALLWAFVVVERRVHAPMVPLDMFRSRDFVGANLLTFLLYGGLGGALFFIPFNLVQVQGYSATAAGAAWLPFILTVAGLSRPAGGLVRSVGARPLLVTGPLVTAAGFALAARPQIGGPYWTTFFPAFLVIGLGMATTVAPLVTVVMGSAGADRSGIASGINNAISRLAGLLVLAAMGLLVQAVFNDALDQRLAELRMRPDVVERFAGERSRLAAATAPSIATERETRELASAVDEAFVAGYRAAMLAAASMAAAGALASWLAIGGRREVP
jgi:EmrB/QacA subfamily drug resistance transporter